MPLMLAPLCSGLVRGLGGEVAALSPAHALLLVGQGFCEVSFPGCQA